MCRVVRRVIHKVDGTFGAMNQLVARRGQGVREAVVPRTRSGCGRLFHGSPGAVVLEGVILRGLRRAALERCAVEPEEEDDAATCECEGR